MIADTHVLALPLYLQPTVGTFVKMIVMVVMSSNVPKGPPALMYQLQDLGLSVLLVLQVTLETHKNATVSIMCQCSTRTSQQCIQWH